jgi:outer membrane lipoprotein SlyB
MRRERNCPSWIKPRAGGGARLVAACVLLAGCASSSPKPVLYPNSHLQQVGQAAADRDIAECRQLASNYGVARTKDGEVAKKAVGGAAAGGASAGAWGLVRGNDAGERALAGAAAGAAAGTVRGAMTSTETSPVYKNFVQKCLRDRGYEVIGWQ